MMIFNAKNNWNYIKWCWLSTYIKFASKFIREKINKQASHNYNIDYLYWLKNFIVANSAIFIVINRYTTEFT